MRWSIIRLIWMRELRDQLRDRRTVLMMAVLPIVLYPALGFGVVQFALSFMSKRSVVGIQGGENLAWTPARGGHEVVAGSQTMPQRLPAGLNPLPAVAWLRLAPAGPGDGIERIASTAALVNISNAGLGQDYPPLVVPWEEHYRFAPIYADSTKEWGMIQVKLLPKSPEPRGDFGNLHDDADWADHVDRSPLETKQVDLLLVVPPDFHARLQSDGRPLLYVLSRENDDRSRLVSNRVHGILARWKQRIKQVRLLRRGLPANYDDPFQIKDSEKAKTLDKRAAEELLDILVRVFPFVLVTWALAGALYPAVDLCAGEKERGTMETLLISPASREEIVWGKFLTIWVFSAATALLNLASMTVTAWQFSGILPQAVLRPAALLWCIVLVLPLSAFFSAVCLAVGAYARSSKEGQHYLMPLFLVTMPLMFLTLAPGVELGPFYSLVPVTGVALLLQKLMAASSQDQVPWLYFLPVLAPMVLYGWLALRWAIEQFKREEVLFREAERLDIGLWLRHVFRDKDTVASTGQAMFCFALIVLLHWISLGFGSRMSLLSRNAIGLLAFVATPTLFMALLLTTRPGQALALRLPPVRALLMAALLAILLLAPLSEVTLCVLRQFPGLMQLLAEHNPLTGELQALGHESRGPASVSALLRYLLVLAVLPAVCEELAFRGFILGGLRRRFQPWMAVLISSFLFALHHFNVFQFVPTFILGVVLGLLAWRSGSVLPGMVFHALHNGLLIGVVMLQGQGYTGENMPGAAFVRVAAAALCTVLAGGLLWRLAVKPGWHEDPPQVSCKPDRESAAAVAPTGGQPVAP
jgi:sodium transport system permease protein